MKDSIYTAYILNDKPLPYYAQLNGNIMTIYPRELSDIGVVQIFINISDG